MLRKAAGIYVGDLAPSGISVQFSIHKSLHTELLEEASVSLLNPFSLPCYYCCGSF